MDNINNNFTFSIFSKVNWIIYVDIIHSYMGNYFLNIGIR